MAPKNRRSTSGLIDQARAEPYRFEFFQLVRLLRLHYSRAGCTEPETLPQHDPLRFSSELSLNFPASEVSDLQFECAERLSAQGFPLSEIQITFMGLIGPSGVLPQPYTEMLMDRHIHQRDDAAPAFLDLFSQRMVALFYQAWQKYKCHIEHERKGSSVFSRYLLNVVGMADEAQQRGFNDAQTSVRQSFFVYFSGLLTQRPRNAMGLQTLLGFYFSLPFKVKPFSGRWLELDSGQCTRLGRSHAALGHSAVAGHRVWDQQSCVRIDIGPLAWVDYQRFQPGSQDYLKLIQIVRFYLGVELDVEIAPLLERGAVPMARLGRGGNLVLGWCGWLKRPDAEVTPTRCALFRIPFDGVAL